MVYETEEAKKPKKDEKIYDRMVKEFEKSGYI